MQCEESDMSKKNISLMIAVGTTLFSGVAMSASEDKVSTDSSPFAMTELESGYMQLAAADKESKTKEASCGEGKCGASMMPKGALEKTSEGKCAGNKPMPKSKKSEGKGMEGKCGEGKCGDNM